MPMPLDGVTTRVQEPMAAVLERQRTAFLADGPPDVALRRNRIDRLMALVLDNADDFVDAMAAEIPASHRMWPTTNPPIPATQIALN